MYSILCLGVIMIADSFGMEIPSWLSPVITFIIIGFFLLKFFEGIQIWVWPK